MAQTYYTKLTPIGEAKLANATALNIPLNITQLGVGDGNGAAVTPEQILTGLKNERRRAALNTLKTDPANANQIIAEQVIPESEGGWYIRELGLYDADGNLIAVGNCPDTYKPVLSEGSGRTQVIRMVLIVSSTSAVQLKIDPAVVLATRSYVDDAVLTVTAQALAAITVELNKRDHKDSVRAATTANLAALSGLLTVDGVQLAAGDRVLVKDQTTTTANGIYVAAAGAWARSADANSGTNLSPGAVVPVEAGTVNADTLWMVKTDTAIIMGAIGVEFQWAGGLNGPTPDRFDNSRKRASTEFVRGALGSLPGMTQLTAGATLDASHIGRGIVCGGAGPYSVVLPFANACPAGSGLLIVAQSATVTITRAGTNAISIGAQNSLTSFVLGAGDWCYLCNLNGTDTWMVMSGTPLLRAGLTSGVFGASIGLSGYQKLPSGLIIQWGQFTHSGSASGGLGLTFPVSFSNTNYQLTGIETGATPTVGFSFQRASASQVTMYTNNASAVYMSWIATGY